MKKRQFGFLLAEKDYLPFLKTNKELIEEISSSFEKVFILNVSGLKLRNKENEIKNISILPKNFEHKYFKNTNDFLNFFKNNEFVTIQYLDKNPDFYKIFFLIKLAKIKNIMIMNLGNFGNKQTPSFNKKNIFAFKHYYEKGFYYFFRILTIFNIFPKIDLLFESNSEIVNAINNGLSWRFEKKFPIFKIAYFRKIELVNSIFYDQYLKYSKIKSNKSDKYILYVDAPIDHADRILREGKVKKEIIEDFYFKIKKSLIYFSKLFNLKIVVALHPSNKMGNHFFSEFEITSKRTFDLIPDCEIVICTHSSLISSAVIFKKKIISLNSKNMGDYISDLTERYRKALNLFSINIDDNININTEEILEKMNNSLKSYDEFIKKRLNPNGEDPSSKKIVKTIKNIFFD